MLPQTTVLTDTIQELGHFFQAVTLHGSESHNPLLRQLGKTTAEKDCYVFEPPGFHILQSFLYTLNPGDGR